YFAEIKAAPSPYNSGEVLRYPLLISLAYSICLPSCPYCRPCYSTRSDQGQDLVSGDTNRVRIRVINNPGPGHRPGTTRGGFICGRLKARSPWSRRAVGKGAPRRAVGKGAPTPVDNTGRRHVARERHYQKST